MKKIISLFCLALMATGTIAAAKVFYCDPASTNEKAKGLSWDDAVTVSQLRKSLTQSALDGATIYIKGGTIQFTQLSDLWTIKASVTLIGGFNPSATGTVTELPTYPSATPTIFNGDINKNGVPDKGDAKALIRVDFSADKSKTITIQGLNLINTYYDEEESPNDEATAMNECAALRLIRGTAYVKNCYLYNHCSPNNRGSQSVTVVGARLHMSDCELHDSYSLTRGGLLRMRQFFINNDPTQPENPDCVLERCCFYNGNNMGGQTFAADAKYGGAVHVSYGPIFAINCTFANNMTYCDGGGINANKDGVSVISCTFVNNVCAAPEDQGQEARYRNTYGSAFRAADDGPMRIANTFALDDKDNGTKNYALIYSDGNSIAMPTLVTSGGYNVLGTFFYYLNGAQVDKQSEVWKSSDVWTPINGPAEHFLTYFGENKILQKNGGFSKTLLPLEMQNGDNVAHLQELADAWCPSWTKVDASVDQRGFKRDAQVTCVGAAAIDAEEPSALFNVKSKTQTAVKTLINGQIVIIKDDKIMNILGF